MSNHTDLAKRIIQICLDAQTPTPTLTIGGNTRYSLSQLEAMTTAERSRWGEWAEEYIQRFIEACYSKAEYPVITDPDGEPVEVEPNIPGKLIIRIVCKSVKPGGTGAYDG